MQNDGCYLHLFIIHMFPLGETILVVELECDSRKNSILGRSWFPTLSNSF